jgi:hypothetical protein
MLTRYKIIWMVSILVMGMIGLTVADQQDFLGVFQGNGGFTMKPNDLNQVGRELRASVPSKGQTGTVIPLRSSDSSDPRARVIQDALDEKMKKE